MELIFGIDYKMITKYVVFQLPGYNYSSVAHQ